MLFDMENKTTASRRGVLAKAALLCAMALALLAPGVALAAGSGGVVSEARLTVYSQYAGEYVSGVKVSAYRVAGLNADGTPDPAGAFASYDVLWDVSGSSSRQALANALEGYVERDKVAPSYSAVSDAEGAAAFPPEGGGGLVEGWYLLLVERYVDGQRVLEAAPTLLAVTSGSDSQEATIKMRAVLMGSSGERITLDVTKTWKGGESDRPAAVNVQLLRNGEVYRTVELNEANGWHYAWKGLFSTYKWTVMEEDVPEGYKVSVVKDGDFVTLVNTYAPDKAPDVPTTPPSGGSEDGKLPDTGDKPSGSNKPATPGKPSTPGGEKLPQTGGMWWPVPVLLAAGLALFAVGLLRRSRG